MTLDITTLNENQREAVEWGDGPLLVLAGPGSGKTRVLTYRIARLIGESTGERYKILALTFTNKAAGEMRERIEQLVPDAPARILLTTFHSFCADILRQHGHHIGLRPDFTILSQDADRAAILDEAIIAKNATEDYESEKLLPLITRLLELNVPLDTAHELLQQQNFRDSERLAGMYREYRGLLINNNRLDFGSLIAECVGLLETRSGITKQLRRIYRYVCVDEFQDTNLAQYRILRQLVNPETRNLFVVADDDQIIYQWNGASPERLNELRDEFGMSVVQLPENYRCPPEVIELANSLIEHNLERSSDKERLRARKPPTAKTGVRLQGFRSLDDEARWVAKDIAGRNAAERSKCAILARTRKVLNVMVDALNSAGVDGFISVRKDEFLSAPLAWLHSMLRLANARQDREQLSRACKAYYKLEGINLRVPDIVSIAASEDGDYLRAWRKAALDRVEDTDPTHELVDKYVAKLADTLSIWEFTVASFTCFDSIETPPVDSEIHDELFRDERDVWTELTNEIIAQYGKENVTLHLLLQELDLRSKAPTPPAGAVPCFTIHASKGMEFGHVYLVALVEDQLPNWAAVKPDARPHELQEERRNCFVAITRTQESLTLTYSAQVFGWNKSPSRFLTEMGLQPGASGE